MAKVVTSAMLLNAQAEVKSLEVDKIEKVLTETDDEIMERLKQRFDILEDMTRAVKKGDVRSMIVTGPPGVGKSFGVEKVLSKHDVFADVANDSKLKKYEVVKGAMSAIGLYSKLYEFRRQHTSAYVCGELVGALEGRNRALRLSAYVSIRQHTYTGKW